MRYSLANYILSIASNDSKISQLFKNVQIGGEGDALSTINIQTTDRLWETDSFATGAWVHNKNLSRVGTCEVSISQLSDAVAKFKTFVAYFYGESADDNIEGVTLTLSDSNNKVIATCEDCYPVQIPSQEFGTKAAEQRWQFTCGRITYA